MKPLPPINLLAARHVQAVKEVAEAANRAAGQGAGYGQIPMAPVGSSSYSVNQTTGNTAETLVPGSDIKIAVPRTMYVLAFAMVSAFMNQNPPIASGNVRIAAGGITESARLRFPFINAGKPSIVQTAYVLAAVAVPGLYTWQLNYYVDTAPDTVTINDFHMDVFLMGM